MDRSVLDRDRHPTVDWDRLTEPEFTRLINALVYHMHPQAQVRPIDGRGGDGGVDIYVLDSDGREIIYQLKFFPGGFDGKHKARRRQISNDNPHDPGSLERAMTTYPDMDEWVLVAPCTPTRSGWVYIDQLAQDHPQVTITFVGASVLDSKWVARHPDVVRAQLSRDETLEKAAIYNQEISVLDGGFSDLLERHERLDRVAAEADPDWRWQITRQGSWRIHELQARHPQAAAVSPVSLHVQMDRSSDDPGVSAFARAVQYGTFEPVRVSGKFISDFTVDGPPMVSSAAITDEIADLVLQPLAEDQTPRELAIRLSADQRHLATHQGVVTNVTQGTHGWRMKQTFHHETVVLSWTLPYDTGGTCNVDVEINFDRPGTVAADVRGVCDLLLTWHRSTHTQLMTSDGQCLGLLGDSSGQQAEEQVQTLRELREFADDLEVVQYELSRQFPWPAEVTDYQRVDLRILRRLLEGRIVCMPDRPVLVVTLDPDKITQSTENLIVHDGQLVHQAERVEWVIAAAPAQEPIELENYVVHYPHVRAEDGEETIARCRRGEESTVRFLPQQQRHPRIYLADKVPAGGVIEPEPWGLTGIQEVPELRH